MANKKNSRQSFETTYSIAAQYYKEHGTLEMPCPNRVEGYDLGTWVQVQRQKYKRGELTAYRIKKLESIGMDWNGKSDPLRKTYKEAVQIAKRYYEKHGNLEISLPEVVEGYQLGIWIREMRCKYKKGLLSPERIRELESIGMIWDANEHKWEQGYREAKRYAKEHGNLKIPKNYITETGYKLGNWANNQRIFGANGKMPEHHRTLLSEIGMIWNATDLKWERSYNAACAFAKENGHLMVKLKYKTPDGLALGHWISAQRTRKKKGTLSQEQIGKLEKIGMTWQMRTRRKTTEEK